MRHDIKVGDKVRFSGQYLRNTGQVRSSSEGRSVWTVTAIHRDWAVTDAPTTNDWYTERDLEIDPSLRFRRIALANLERVS